MLLLATDGVPRYLSVLALLMGPLLYVYFSGSLMVIARKTNTPNPWLAWVPIGNLYLVCQIAGRSPAWILLLTCCPFINLIPAAILAMDVARARGKPPGMGLLMLVPGVNLFLPAYLAMGDGAQTVHPPGMRAPVTWLPRSATVSGSATAWAKDHRVRWAVLLVVSVVLGFAIGRLLPHVYPWVDSGLKRVFGAGRYTAAWKPLRRSITIAATFATTFLICFLFRPKGGSAATTRSTATATMANLGQAGATGSPVAPARGYGQRSGGQGPPPLPVVPKAPFTLSVVGREVPLADGVRLTFVELPGLQPGAGNVVAEVTRNPHDPSVLGLKNRTRAGWSARTPRGEIRTILPDQSIKLEVGTCINFGPVQGVIG